MNKWLSIFILALFWGTGSLLPVQAEEAEWIDDAPVARMPITATKKADHLEKVLELVNQERAKENLQPLSFHDGLNQAARIRVNEQPTLFSHTRPDGRKWSTVLDEAGVAYRFAAENIACGQETPQEVVADWMDSPGHRKNILTPDFVYMGLGILQTADGTVYWEQLFLKE